MMDSLLKKRREELIPVKINNSDFKIINQIMYYNVNFKEISTC